MSYMKMAETRELPSATLGDAVAGVMGFIERGLPLPGRRDVPILSVTPERATALRKMPYEEYLLTFEWKDVSTAIKRAAQERCEICGELPLWLDVHHLTYERRGNEWWSDLLAACRLCHFMAHKMLGGKL